MAANKSTPPDTLTVLSADTIVFVRQDVAGNPSTPPGTLAADSARTPAGVNVTTGEILD